MTRTVFFMVFILLDILVVSASGREEQKMMAVAPSYQQTAMNSGEMEEEIEPLIKSKWDGTAPFNQLLPQNAKVGDIGVMLAQIMYYYQYPKESTIPVAAYCGFPELPTITFKWEDMTDEYDEYSTPEQIMAVAELMNYTAKAVQTMFNKDSYASFFFAPKALCQYFGYDKGVRLLQRNHFGIDEWDDVIYEELKAGRPVLYYVKGDGVSVPFIIDGYKKDGSFHVNWGWNGNNNGYYKLSELKPLNYGGYNLSVCQHFALIGVQPMANGQSSGPEVQTGDISAYTKEYELNGTTWNGIHVERKQYCVMSDDNDVEMGLGLYKDGKLAYVIDSELHNNVLPGEYVVIKDLNLSKELQQGDYLLRTISRKAGSTEWLPDAYSDERYACLSINGDKLSTSNGEYPARQIVQAGICHVRQLGDVYDYEVDLRNDGRDFAGGIDLYYKVNPNDYEGGDPMITIYLEIKQGETTKLHFQLPEEVDYCYAELPLEYNWNEEDFFLQVPHPSFSISNIVNAIKEVTDIPQTDGQRKIYSIEGIQMPEIPQKGIYIFNGRKIVVR